MFIATKYEDVIPLLMRTIIKKIGHDKFTKAQVTAMELELLGVIKFNLGAPTVFEHLNQMSTKLNIHTNDKIQLVFTYLSKLALHNYELSQLSAAELAGAVAYVGLKICEKTPGSIPPNAALECLNKHCGISIKHAKLNGRFLLNKAKSFE